MKKTLGQKMLAHGGVYAFSQLLNGGIGFLLIPVYAHLLGDEGYGTISLMVTVGTAVNYLILQGLPFAWYRLRFDQKDPQDLRVFETTITWHLIGSIIIGILVISFFGPKLAERFTPQIDYYPFGFLTIISACLLTFPNMYQRKLQAEQQPITFAVFTACRSLTIPVTIIIFVVVLRRGVLGKMEADAISAGILAVISLYFIRPMSFLKFSFAKLRNSLAYGLPLVPHSLMSLANNLIDQMLINIFLGLGQTGVYSMGYKVSSIAVLMAIALNQAFAPLFFSTMKQVELAHEAGDKKAADLGLRSITRASLLMIVAVAMCILCVTAAGRELLLLITTKDFSQSWKVIPLVSAGTLVWACYFPFATAILYNSKKVKMMPIITGAAAGVNIIANIIMIPKMGIIGAAWATLLSNAVMTLLAFAIARSAVNIPHRWSKWFITLAVTSIGLAGIWAIESFIGNVAIRIIIKYLLALLCIIIILWKTEYKLGDIKKIFARTKENNVNI